MSLIADHDATIKANFGNAFGNTSGISRSDTHNPFDACSFSVPSLDVPLLPHSYCNFATFAHSLPK